MKLSQRQTVRFLNLAKNGRFMFGANHFHIEATLDKTDSDKLPKHSS